MGNSSSATTNRISWTIDYTIPVHGESRGLPHVLIEIWQEGIATRADAAAWAVRLPATYAQVEPVALRLCGTSRR